MKIPQALDYNKTTSWFSLPTECSANAIPSHTKENSELSPLLADVFFIHGTVLHGEGKKYLDPADQNHRDLPLYPRQAHASCFEKCARIFQPHYRQASLEMHFDEWDTIQQAYHVPCDDIINAYNAYMENWNEGRPIIIAGNSQGSILALELLKYLHKNGKTFNKLIAAYIIGFTVTPSDLIECGLPLSQSFNDTQCIITYNSLAQGGTEGLTIFPNALCTNPLNWRTDSEYADKSLHLGSFDLNASKNENGTENKKIPEYTDTWIDTKTGGLIVGAYTLENAPPRPFFPVGDLHSYNYPLFYRNLENNALARTKAYYAKNKIVSNGMSNNE